MQTKWYQTTIFSVLALILFFPVGLYTMWRYTGWNKLVKGSVTALFGLFVLIAILNPAPPKEENKPVAQQQAMLQHTEQAQTQPEAPKYVFDVPTLLGKNVDELRQVLGSPTGNQLEPTQQQIDLGVNTWDNTFEKDGRKLLATYDPQTRVVEDLFIGTNDSSGSTKDKQTLLEVGNLKEGSSTYKVEFVKTIKDPSAYTGVKASLLQ